jgi:protein TonB
MLTTLLESNAPRQRRRWSTIASVVVHTAIIAGAIVATASARTEPSKGRVVDNRLTYVQSLTRRQAPLRPAMPSQRQGGRGGVGAPALQLPRGPQLVWNRPSGPTIDVDPRALIGDPVEGPDRACIVGCLPTSGSDSTARTPLTAAAVDRIATLLTEPRPRYPDQLRGAGVSGRVIAQFVVDTLGRVEPASIVIREAAHGLFANAVRAVLPSLRFKPAEAGGHKVRMLVELPFEFRLDR